MAIKTEVKKAKFNQEMGIVDIDLTGPIVNPNAKDMINLTNDKIKVERKKKEIPSEKWDVEEVRELVNRKANRDEL